jgi:hypothetical protein
MRRSGICAWTSDLIWQQYFDTWDGSEMNQFTLTSVGIAIAHANIKRLVGEFANLSMWIN